ncbi:MAG: hypothetical protein QME92_10695 [Bacillota bacterium]|nr:hypothetical protein [Bacillota bacterium]
MERVVHESIRYVRRFNPAEAEHDRAVREAVVAALRERCFSDPSRWPLGNSGHSSRYAGVEGAKLSIAEDAGKAEEMYDAICAAPTGPIC